MNKQYFVEIIAAIFFVLLFTFMIFTWKNMAPEKELSDETLEVLTDNSEGVKL